MNEIKIIELKQSVFEDNNKDAQDLRNSLKADRTFLVNLMSSPGSGKTSLLLKLAEEFKGKLSWGVMEADIDSAVDAKTTAPGRRLYFMYLILSAYFVPQ